MGAWVTSIVGVICLGILLDIVLPEGKTTKYIRGAFSLIVILAIVAPIPSLLKKEWKINADVSAISQSEGEIGFDAANTFAQSYAQKCEQALKEKGIDAECEIDYADGVLKSVSVKTQSRYDGDKIVAIVSESLSVAPFKVFVLYV